MEKTRVRLEGVPETLLWTLYMRASEARRPGSVIDDPMAVELLERIDYPFEERFGAPRLAQWQALRARTFDDEVRRFLGRHPDGTVVALGEGLETQFWRVDNGSVNWVTVELPETLAVRELLLPRHERVQTIGGSALDEAWMDEVDASRGLLITAQGLLMYFEPAEVHGLIARCGARFPAAELVFDAIPRWLAERSQKGQLKGPSGYQPPPWKWGIDSKERRLMGARRLRPPRGRGVVGSVVLPQLLYVMAISL
jgi:O-methyltransferase involved in polyketide biosynthesis